MKLSEFRKLLDTALEDSSDVEMLVKVAIPNDSVDYLSDQSPEPVTTVQTYTHLDVENISAFCYRDPGEENWVLYIKTKEQS